jgi:hypothetical protein
MVLESAVDLIDRKCDCGYHVRKSDCFYVEDYDVYHLICYNCSHEWVTDVGSKAEEEE